MAVFIGSLVVVMYVHLGLVFVLFVVQLLTVKESTQLGLCLVLTLSQELSSLREDLSMTRREQLRGLVLERTPALLQVLTTLLQETAAKQEISFPTPPISPANSLQIVSPPGSRSASPVPFHVRYLLACGTVLLYSMILKLNYVNVSSRVCL